MLLGFQVGTRARFLISGQPGHCATIDITRQDLAFADVGLEVYPFTGYDSLEDALMDIIDCQAIQRLVDDLWFLPGSAPDIIQACENMKPSAYELLAGLLDQIGMDWKLLRFNGWATITTMDADPPYATELGYSNHEDMMPNSDGHWEGTFDVILDGDITGSWHGER